MSVVTFYCLNSCHPLFFVQRRRAPQGVRRSCFQGRPARYRAFNRSAIPPNIIPADKEEGEAAIASQALPG